MSPRRRWLTVDGNPDQMTVRQQFVWTLRSVLPVTVTPTAHQQALHDAVHIHASIGGSPRDRLLQRIAGQMGVDDHDMQVVAYLLGDHCCAADAGPCPPPPARRGASTAPPTTTPTTTWPACTPPSSTRPNARGSR